MVAERELRLLILGDSAAAGVGAATQSEALSGQVVTKLSGAFRVSWRLLAHTGCTTRAILRRLEQEPPAPYDVALTSLGVNDVASGRTLDTWLENSPSWWTCSGGSCRSVTSSCPDYLLWGNSPPCPTRSVLAGPPGGALRRILGTLGRFPARLRLHGIPLRRRCGGDRGSPDGVRRVSPPGPRFTPCGARPPQAHPGKVGQRGFPLKGKGAGMAYWLVKTEPGAYAWADLVRDKKAAWTGGPKFRGSQQPARHEAW